MSKNGVAAHVAHFRALLEAQLSELEALRASTSGDRSPVELDQQSVGRLSRIDAMQSQQMSMAADRNRQSQMTLIREALRRIDEGEFGYCLECGEEIALGRLRADPTAALCIACAREQQSR